MKSPRSIKYKYSKSKVCRHIMTEEMVEDMNIINIYYIII